MFSPASPEKRVPADHLLRGTGVVDLMLKQMLPRFGQLYSEVGRVSTAPGAIVASLRLLLFRFFENSAWFHTSSFMRSSGSEANEMSVLWVGGEDSTSEAGNAGRTRTTRSKIPFGIARDEHRPPRGAECQEPQRAIDELTARHAG